MSISIPMSMSMSMPGRLVLATAAVLLFAPPVLAAPQSYSLDPAHTSVGFAISHLGFSQMQGRFNDISGSVSFDAAAPKDTGVKVTLKASSVDTNFAKRDDHLRSPDFFNVKEFPEISFVSSAVEMTGEKTARLTGSLTLLGVSRPVTLDVVFNRQGESPASKKETVGFSARGSLKRSEFGMKYGIPNLGDTVELAIEVEAVR